MAMSVNSLDQDAFNESGYVVLPTYLDKYQIDKLAQDVSKVEACRAGTRRLLDYPWCQDTARSLKADPALNLPLAPDMVAVQCTYFEKSRGQNWLVALHQDLSIPVRERINHEACTGWSEKEGVTFVQPSIAVLECLVAVRVHLDDSVAINGPLRVVPGSHRHGRLATEQAQALRREAGELDCLAKKGEMIVLRPLILHASSKSETPAPRRVLHFVFGPRDLPCGLQWQIAV